ncbi:hypothetical protein [Nocardioides sp. SYSU D00065]|uniref:hypothetical protein n=1 Tax=Nocardioides sp. SYSU D00065 TaxID=2817378 RepID=UPI001B33917F|nr:hypothetical protein [Nocardioides sp. SYSU D00065]
MPKKLAEQALITEAAAAAAKDSGRLPIQFISPGWGSSGYYSPEVIAEAAETKFIPAGTHMYADHPTDAEDAERPGRSIKDLMAVVVEDAYLSPDGALVGEADVVPAWRDLLETVRDHIGVSIRGSATDIVEGEAEGRRGRIVEGLVAPCTSVDFVTRAGRGGKVLQVMESAAANQRAISHGVEEATVNDTREALQTTLRDAYAGAKTWIYVRDFDDSTVWFEIEGDGDDNGIYAQGYAMSDSAGASLSGDRTEVRVQTTYVPVTRPGSTTDTTTEESEEDTMPKIQIEEAEHARLVDAAGRVKTLESERDTEKARADVAESTLATERRRARAMDLIREHDHAFTPLEAKGLVADLPLTESGAFDETKFAELLAEHAASAAQAGGAGQVSGFGQTTDTGKSTTESAPAPAKTAWGRTLSEKGA